MNREVKDTGEGRRKRGLVFGQPWIGPPLQKKQGKFKFDDEDKDTGKALI